MYANPPGPTAYDYVEVRRDFLAWTPAQQEQRIDGVGLVPQHGIEEHQMLANGTASASRGSEEAEKRAVGSSDRSNNERSINERSNNDRPQ